MQREREYHSDSSHGWIKVAREELRELNLVVAVSPYSYASDDGFVFLEEDADGMRYARAVAERGDTLVLVDRYTDGESPVRQMRRYDASNA